MNSPPLTGDQCRCTSCGLAFKSTSGFDAHRVGKYPARRCLSLTELQARGYAHNNLGFMRKPRPTENTHASP